MNDKQLSALTHILAELTDVRFLYTQSATRRVQRLCLSSLTWVRNLLALRQFLLARVQIVLLVVIKEQQGQKLIVMFDEGLQRLEHVRK